MKVDVHSHVFNLHFLPVAGAIRGISKNFSLTPKGLPIFLCNLIAWYYLKKMERGEVDQTKSLHEYEHIDQNFEDLINPLAIDHSGLGLKDPSQDQELKDFIIDQTGDQTLNEIGIAQADLEELNLSGNETVKEFLGTNKMNEAFVAIPWGKIAWFIVRYVAKWAYNRYLKPYLNWFNFMTKDYEVITRELFADYPQIDFFIHHDMDMDDWYELAPPTFSYEEQVNRVSVLAKGSNGKLIPFFAYNPKKSLELLKVAIDYNGNDNHKGYKGVKFYPPSGYLPWYEDSNNPWQVRNLELFQFCSDNDIPVFTHCNYGGMQAGGDYWKNNDVAYWEKVLIKFPTLRLCFGHSGGDEGWLGEFDNKKLQQMGHDTFEKTFSGQIYKLCTTYQNVYCEFGYLPEIMKVEERNKFRQQLVSCIQNTTVLPFSKKIIYGTDWHMLMQEHGYQDYYNSFDKLFNHESLKAYKDQFFGLNALNYLKMPIVNN